jgi:hypothetical protein
MLDGDLAVDFRKQRFAGHRVSTPERSRIRIKGNSAASAVEHRIFCSTDEICAVDGSTDTNSAACPEGERRINVPSTGGCAALKRKNARSTLNSGAKYKSPFAVRLTANFVAQIVS